MSTSTTPPTTVRAHIQAISEAAAAFNTAIAAAAHDSVRVRYTKSPTQPGAWSGPLHVVEIAHVVVFDPQRSPEPPATPAK